MKTHYTRQAAKERKDKEEKKEEDGENAEGDVNTTPVHVTTRKRPGLIGPQWILRKDKERREEEDGGSRKSARRKKLTNIGESYNAARSLTKQKKQRSALKSIRSS